MTLLRESEELELDEAEPRDADPESELVPSSTDRARSWKRVLTIGVLGLAVLLVTLALFEGPVQNTWYSNRQRQLAADMKEPRPGVAPGQAIAVLQVPRLGVNAVVIEGDGPERLRSGPGHRISSAKPGKRGNSVIMGHRDAWGGPFDPLGRLRRGDLIALQTRLGETVVYRVRALANVGGGDARLLRSSKDFRLTLITGRGGRFSEDRLVITAISGERARGSATVRPVRAETPGPSVIFNFTLLVAIVAFALAAGAAIYLRHRSGIVARVVVVLPLLAIGTLCLLLDIDLLLPPLN